MIQNADGFIGGLTELNIIRVDVNCELEHIYGLDCLLAPSRESLHVESTQGIDMNVVHRQRYLIPLLDGNTINVLVEEQANPRLYKYAAVLDDWNYDCKFNTANTVDEAIEGLADLLDVTLPHDWRIYGSSGRLRSIEVTGAAA